MAEVILALDLPSPDAALRLLDRIPELRWVKVGPVVLTGSDGSFVRTLVDRGLNVFLDCKWHDIPHTVEQTVTSARALGVRMVTVHALGGTAMLHAAAGAGGEGLAVVGVTVLTSHAGAEFGRVLGRETPDLRAEAGRLAALALDAGLRGVVCSAAEVSGLRERFGPDPWLVVPGIRRATDAVGDQKRTATPAIAAAQGASHLVVGRPILGAADPRSAFREFAEEARC